MEVTNTVPCKEQTGRPINMRGKKAKNKSTLMEKYPPSAPCTCDICTGYCKRPGWWTVDQAARAFDAGYGNRMMLEIAPELTFGVLSPAFKGSERSIATNMFARNGCTFFRNERCELFGTGHEPLECRFCHHERQGLGPQCHAALEKNWRSVEGQALVDKWIKQFHPGYRVF
jgi:hypothetical protein